MATESRIDALKRHFQRLWALESELKANDQIIAIATKRIENSRQAITDLESQLRELLGEDNGDSVG